VKLFSCWHLGEYHQVVGDGVGDGVGIGVGALVAGDGVGERRHNTWRVELCCFLIRLLSSGVVQIVSKWDHRGPAEKVKQPEGFDFQFAKEPTVVRRPF